MCAQNIQTPCLNTAQKLTCMLSGRLTCARFVLRPSFQTKSNVFLKTLDVFFFHLVNVDLCCFDCCSDDTIVFEKFILLMFWSIPTLCVLLNSVLFVQYTENHG